MSKLESVRVWWVETFENTPKGMWPKVFSRQQTDTVKVYEAKTVEEIFEKTRKEAEMDYNDMRRFQMKFIESDRQNRRLKELAKRASQKLIEVENAFEKNWAIEWSECSEIALLLLKELEPK